MPDITIDVWCNTCNEGLCSETTVNKNNSFYVNVCPVCIGKKDVEIEKLEERIKELENQIGEK